ncbi:uncharacterized protein [Diadema antillarum]|uniref:uncharacterized protein n=1 Tax=Diadema antillarum TaxID=105358 RepID=UPI003A882F4C
MVSTVTREVSPSVTNVGSTSPVETSVPAQSRSVMTSCNSGKEGHEKKRHYCRHYVLPRAALVLLIVAVIVLFVRLKKVERKIKGNPNKHEDEALNSTITPYKQERRRVRGVLFFLITILLIVVISVLGIRLRRVERQLKVRRTRHDDTNKGSSEDVTTARYTDVKDLCRSLPSIPQGDHGRADDNQLESEICVKNPLYFCVEETAERNRSKQAAEEVGKDGEKIGGAVHVDDEKRRGDSNVVVATLHQSPSSTPSPLIVDHLYETVQETFRCKPEDGPSVSQSRHESESDITTSPYDRLNRGFVLPVTGQEKPPQPGQPNPTEYEHNDKVSDDLPGKPTLQDSDTHESESDPGTNDRLNDGFVLPVTGQEKPPQPGQPNPTEYEHNDKVSDDLPGKPTLQDSDTHESESDPGTNDRLNDGFVLPVTGQEKPPQPGQPNPIEDEHNDKVSDDLPGKPTLEDSERQSEIHVYSNCTEEGKPLEATDRQSEIHVYSNCTDEGKLLEATETSAYPANTDK